MGTTGPAIEDRSTPRTATPAVELIEITKTFPGVVANDSISLVAMPGEVEDAPLEMEKTPEPEPEPDPSATTIIQRGESRS